MIDVTLHTALREQHRCELLMEAEMRRVMSVFPKRQRLMRMLARAIHTGWKMLRKRSVNETVAFPFREKEGIWMLVRYYPANDFDPNCSN